LPPFRHYADATLMMPPLPPYAADASAPVPIFNIDYFDYIVFAHFFQPLIFAERIYAASFAAAISAIYFLRRLVFTLFLDELSHIIFSFLSRY
jgi:hypothetical protein